MTKVSVKPINLNRTPHLTAHVLQNIECGTFVTLLNEPNSDNKTKDSITESQFYLLPKGNKGLIISKNIEKSTVSVMKFNKLLGDGELVDLLPNQLAIPLDVEELVLLANFEY